jgi:hypothetical protein
MQDDIPRIQAECAECGKLFDIKFGFSCPSCHYTGMSIATLIANAENVMLSYTNDYPGRLCSPYAHTQGDAKDIAELERLYLLEDNR